MKIIIFSDVHLSSYFDKKKLNFLKKLINRADQVIINGDFWEGFDIEFDNFIKSPWKRLFPLLKKKKAIYIYGNHDEKDLSNKGVNLFSVAQAHQYKFTVKGKTFIVEHGHRILPLIDVIFFNKYLGINPPKLSNKMYEKIEGVLFRLFGKFFLRLAYAGFNREMKTKLKSGFKNNHFLIFGHTHFAEFDKTQNFINSGFMRHGLAQYIEIDEKGQVTLKEERYR